MKIFATYNIKGGVGKTASAVNLSYLSAKTGARTLVWDLDPQGAATYYFRSRPKIKGGGKRLVKGKNNLEDLIKATEFERLDLLPADFSYRNMELMLEEAKKPTQQLGRLLKPLAKYYDHIFLDCPPSASLVSENVFYAAHYLLLPVIPTTLSIRTLDQVLTFLKEEQVKGLKVFPFLTMVDRRKRMHRELMQALPVQYPGFLKGAVPYSSDVERMGIHRSAVGTFAPRGAAARAYRALWAELQARM